MRRIILYLLLMFGLSGCVIVGNLDEISTLKDYSAEKDQQHKSVKQIDDHYDDLAKAIDGGKINQYKNQDELVRDFGEPLLKKSWNGGERWLYRHAIFRLSKDKVYLYFNAQGQLTRWERLPCSLSF